MILLVFNLSLTMLVHLSLTILVSPPPRPSGMNLVLHHSALVGSSISLNLSTNVTIHLHQATYHPSSVVQTTTTIRERKTSQTFHQPGPAMDNALLHSLVQHCGNTVAWRNTVAQHCGAPYLSSSEISLN